MGGRDWGREQQDQEGQRRSVQDRQKVCEEHAGRLLRIILGVIDLPIAGKGIAGFVLEQGPLQPAEGALYLALVPGLLAEMELVLDVEVVAHLRN